jgi:hypothetical protein
MNPRNVITVPLTPNSASSPAVEVAPSRIVRVCPRASAICEATVRIQISS